jgi:hypothetical protein
LSQSLLHNQSDPLKERDFLANLDWLATEKGKQNWKRNWDWDDLSLGNRNQYIYTLLTLYIYY